MPADRSHVGLAGQPVTMRIEYGKILEFARAIHDDDACYRDGPGDSLMPPVTFLATVALWDDGTGRPAVPYDMQRLLHGEQEVEFFKPIRVNDVLTAITRVTDVYRKPGRRGGAMTFTVCDTDFTNQRQELVARLRDVRIETESAGETGP